MGVICSDPLQLDNGLTVANSFATFGDSQLTTSVTVAADGSRSYSASGIVNFFIDENAYKDGKLQPLYRTQVAVPLDSNSVNAVYGIMLQGFAAQNANVRIVDYS